MPINFHTLLIEQIHKNQLMYHGTPSKKKKSILDGGFKLIFKPVIYFSASKEIAKSYGYNQENNLITVDISNLNIYYFKDNPPRYFFNPTEADLLKYKEKGYDGFGLSNGSEIAVFYPEKIKIIK